MPISLEIITSPSGTRILRGRTSGRLTLLDAESFERAGAPAIAGAGLPYLGVLEKGVEVSAEFRGYFARPVNLTYPAVAMVIPTSPIRILATLMVKLARSLNPRLISMPVEFFSDEAQARDWLEATLDAQRPRAAAS